MRYFDFIKEIKEISTSHILVNEYGEGDIYEYLNNGEHKYPCIFLTVTNLTTTQSGTAINFTLFFTDRLVENQENKTAIQSTGISVIKQILSRYEQLHPEYLLSNVEYTPFTEKFTDMCAGVFCDVVIENQIDTLEDYDNECEEGSFAVKTITLTKNGVYDIVGYDTAVVLVEGEDVKLESITITENGVYVPEEGGYNEVIVNVAGGGDKMKVYSLKLNNDCIVDGTWNTDGIDTSNVTNMSQMFSGCTSLQSLDLSSWDTILVTDMHDMFSGCSSLQTLDVSNFDTSNVTKMYGMFQDCSSLQTLDVSNFDTSNVTSMGYMLSNCSSLQTLDVSNFDTSKVTSMGYMFSNCSSLQIIDVSNWDTSNVTNMIQMFSNCSSLQIIDVSNWDTSKVTNMGGMFSGCSSLQTIDVSNWDTSKVPNMYAMFSGCSSLQTIDVSNWDTSKVTNMISMFIYCKKLTTLIGGRTIDEVIYNNISALNGLKINITLNDTILDRASLRAVINGLADLTGSTSQTLTLGSTLIAKLTEEDIAIATAKNWTIA